MHGWQISQQATTAALIVLLTSNSIAQQSTKSPDNDPTLERRALRVMEDVVPATLPTDSFALVTFEQNYARWGRLFGDRLMGALVAERKGKPQRNSSLVKADVCLLIWDNGWQFRQHVGEVFSEVDSDKRPDWVIKASNSPRAFYIISGMDLYPSKEHASWLCDPKTHRLTPTGWRKDAIPSIAGRTITFTHQEKPGYSPVIRDIYQFDGKQGEPIARVTQREGPDHTMAPLVTVHAPGSDKAVTWKIWKKSRDFNHRSEIYAIGRVYGGKTGGEPKEDVLVEFDWEGSEDTYDPITFLLWRLTGLDRNALDGRWDREEKRDVVVPRTAKVTGTQEDIERFQWPPPR